MPELPVELWQAIVENIESHSDLLSLVLTSINFNSIAERRLYHTICFRDDGLAEKQWSVFERIRTCPRVAFYVLHLIIELVDWPLSYHCEYTPSRYAPAFSSLPNLKSLQLWPIMDFTAHLQPNLPFLLHTFHYSESEVFDNSYFRPILESFLEAQVELKELVLRSYCEIKLTATALPALTTILAGGKFVRAIVPGRPIQRVAIYSEDQSPFPEGSHTHSLRIYSTRQLKWYTAVFSRLIFFQCMVIKLKDIPPLVSYIQDFIVLKKLRIIVGGYRHQYSWTDGEVLALVHQVFDAGSPSLSCIETLHGISKMWTRGSSTAIDSSWDRHEWRKI